MTDRFVWLAWNGRVSPAKWPADMPRNTSHPAQVIAEHPIGPDEFKLTLSELAKLYPAPEQVSP